MVSVLCAPPLPEKARFVIGDKTSCLLCEQNHVPTWLETFRKRRIELPRSLEFMLEIQVLSCMSYMARASGGGCSLEFGAGCLFVAGRVLSCALKDV